MVAILVKFFIIIVHLSSTLSNLGNYPKSLYMYNKLKQKQEIRIKKKKKKKTNHKMILN